MYTGRSTRSARGTRTITTEAPPASSTVTSESSSRLALTFCWLFSVFQRSWTKASGFVKPDGKGIPSSPSTAPNTMIPPSVLANAEYVSQKLRGSPPRASLNSRRLPSRYREKRSDISLGVKASTSSYPGIPSAVLVELSAYSSRALSKQSKQRWPQQGNYHHQ